MINDLVTITNDALPGIDLIETDTETLRRELASTLTMTARQMQRLALIWQELERRGEDLSDLRTGLASYFPLIASGKLDAQAVVQFAGKTTLLNKIALLPLAEQRKLAEGGNVTLVVAAPEGGFREVDKPVHALTLTQTMQVFGDGRIRSPKEQFGIVEDTLLKRSKGSDSKNSNRPLYYDSNKRKWKMREKYISTEDIIAAFVKQFEQLDQEYDNADVKAYKNVMLQFTEKEHYALSLKKLNSGTSISRLCKQAIRMMGLLENAETME